jgi:hypothetical protein
MKYSHIFAKIIFMKVTPNKYAITLYNEYGFAKAINLLDEAIIGICDYPSSNIHQLVFFSKSLLILKNKFGG